MEEAKKEQLDTPAIQEQHSSSLSDDSLTDLEKQYQSVSLTPRKIYVLGTGSIGKLIAHSLRSLPNPPPVTLILHRAKLLEAWEAGPKTLTLNRDGVDIVATGFDAQLSHETRNIHKVPVRERDEHLFEGDMKPHEVAKLLAERQGDISKYRPELRKGSRHAELSGDIIHHLIVTTKTSLTAQALLPIKHRLRPYSTICLIQNGMGVVDELNERLFPDPATRPKYIQGIISHGVNVPPAVAEHNPFYAVHAGQGTIALGLLPSSNEIRASYPRYLLRTLTRSPVLVAVSHSPTELLQLQIEKLAVNSVLNPLTALLDSRNGSILHNYALTRTLRLLLAETSLVIRSLPELRGMPNVANRFSAERLEAMVVKLATNTAENISSMLADIRAGRQTEIEYINGYIIRRGEELGIKCVVNYGIMNTVIGKSKMTRNEVLAEIRTEENVDLNQGL